MLLGRRDNRITAQIALSWAVTAQIHRLITRLHMQRLFIRLRGNGQGGNSHLPGRAGNAASNFAAVGNQQFLNHFCNLSA